MFCVKQTKSVIKIALIEQKHRDRVVFQPKCFIVSHEKVFLRRVAIFITPFSHNNKQSNKSQNLMKYGNIQLSLSENLY